MQYKTDGLLYLKTCFNLSDTSYVKSIQFEMAFEFHLIFVRNSCCNCAVDVLKLSKIIFFIFS